MHIAKAPSFSQATPIISEPIDCTPPPGTSKTQSITAPTHCEFSLADDFKEALEFAAQRRQRSLQWVDLNEIHPQSTTRSNSRFGVQSGRDAGQKTDDQIKVEYGRLLCEIVNLSLVWLAGTAINLGCGILSTFILLSFIAVKLIQSGAEQTERDSV